MAKRIEVTFKMPPGCRDENGEQIGKITIRETTGVDESAASLSHKAKGEKGAYLDELIRLAVAKVDGADVEQPFASYEEWNSKARAWTLKGFLKVNGTGATEQDEKDFFEGAEVSEGSAAGVKLDELIG